MEKKIRSKNYSHIHSVSGILGMGVLWHIAPPPIHYNNVRGVRC